MGEFCVRQARAMTEAGTDGIPEAQIETMEVVGARHTPQRGKQRSSHWSATMTLRERLAIIIIVWPRRGQHREGHLLEPSMESPADWWWRVRGRPTTRKARNLPDPRMASLLAVRGAWTYAGKVAAA